MPKTIVVILLLVVMLLCAMAYSAAVRTAVFSAAAKVVAKFPHTTRAPTARGTALPPPAPAAALAAGTATGGATNVVGGDSGGGDVHGGGRSVARHWTDYDTWDELFAAPTARRAYLADRDAALDDLQFDWTEVNAVLQPKLQDKREYVGHINARRDDPRRLYVDRVEATPEVTGPHGTVFAVVPSGQFERLAARPALFMFHTHPDLPMCSPLPSATDVATAVRLCMADKYAAQVVVSRYGALLYAPSTAAYRDIRAAADPDLATAHLRHDVASALEGSRSWRQWTLDDYANMFRMYRMLYVVYPTPLYSAFQARKGFIPPLPDDPNDEDLLEALRHDIAEQRRVSRKKAK